MHAPRDDMHRMQATTASQAAKRGGRSAQAQPACTAAAVGGRQLGSAVLAMRDKETGVQKLRPSGGSLLEPRVPPTALTLFTNVRVWSAGLPSPHSSAKMDEVLVEGNRIATLVLGGTVGVDQLIDDGARVIDGGGRVLMPGLIDGHAHLSFHDITRLEDAGDMPPEENLLWTQYNAVKMLDAGFTSCFSAASSRVRLDVVVREEINAGRLPGPRLRAASPEITATGSLGDVRQVHQEGRTSIELISDSPDEMRAICRMCAREGVDTIKINIGGETLTPENDDIYTTMTEEEIATAVQVAHSLGKKVAAHCRGNRDVKLAVQHGVDVIYHCDFSDDEAVALLVAAKDRVVVNPAVALLVKNTEGTDEHDPVSPAVGQWARLHAQQRTYAALREAGVRVAIGGDYGFRATPQGEQAKDIAHFVEEFGYSAVEALECATAVGGDLMEMDVGRIKEGFLADLLLVDGEPTVDVGVLQEQANLRLIMLDGVLYKDTLQAEAVGGAAQELHGAGAKL
jgi:imidazolonepropionase-like amidohydrolase